MFFGRGNGKSKDAKPAKPAAKPLNINAGGKPPPDPARMAMAQRIREDRDPKLRDKSGFEDGLGPERRRSMNASLAIIGAMDPAAMAKTLAADQSFARVEQLRGGHALLTATGITNGTQFKGVGERLNGPTLGRLRDADVAAVKLALRTANPRAPLDIMKSLGEHAQGTPALLLGDAAFCELVVKQNKAADLLAHIKVSAWKVGIEFISKDPKIAAFISSALSPAA